MDEEKVPETISAFAYECAMAHKDADNERMAKECERMHKTIRALALTFLLVILVFVVGYTIRTRYWLETLAKFQTTPIVEVQDGVHNQPDQ